MLSLAGPLELLLTEAKNKLKKVCTYVECVNASGNCVNCCLKYYSVLIFIVFIFTCLVSFLLF